MIEIHQLRVSKSERTTCAVPDLCVAHGERVSILGANGSGKTTLLRVLAGIEGEYDGRCAVNSRVQDRVYVHQTPYLFRGTALSNVKYGLGTENTARRDQLALDWLERLGVPDVVNRCAGHLSGGERRRVALARAMILHPRLLLLDEPFADMDEQGRSAVSEALNELTETTVLITSPTALSPGITGRSITLHT